MKVFIFLFLMTTVDCLRIQFFELPNYHDLFLEFELSSEQEKSCITINETAAEIKSIKTDKCIIMYDASGCTSIKHARVDNSTRSYTNKVELKSFHVCSQELGGGPLLDVAFLGNRRGDVPFLEYKKVCGCKNIPGTHDELMNKDYVFVNNHGNGLAVFEKENCQPPHFYFAPGEYFLVDESKGSLRGIKVRSFSPMGTTRCAKLSASVTRFTFTKDSPDKLMDVKNVTSSLESVFRNNGTATISQDYTASQRYKESLEITKALGWSTVHNVGVSGSVETTSQVDIPLVLSAKIKTTVGGSYAWTDTHSGTDTTRRIEENEETTTIHQAIVIPPCTEYHVNSYVQMAKNYSVDYTATARLTGKAGDDNMDANELKKNVGAGMEFVRELDKFAIEVQVKGQMFAKFGMKTFIVGEGNPIEGCLKNFPKNLRPNPQKHFEIELPLKN